MGTCISEPRKSNNYMQKYFSSKLLKFALKRIYWYKAQITTFIHRYELSLSKKNTYKSSPNAKSIVYIRSDFWTKVNTSGGAVAHTKGVIEAFLKKGLNVRLFSPYSIECISNETLDQYIVTPQILSEGFGEVQELEFNNQFISTIDNHINRDDILFVYQRYGLNSFAGAYIAKKYNLPFILEYNGSEIWMGDNWGSKIKYRLTAGSIEILNFRAANIIIGNAYALKKELISRGIDQNKILIIPNGVDPDIFNSNINGATLKQKLNIGESIVVGFMGTFGPWHGAEVLAKSVNIVLEENQDIHFLFLGNGIRKQMCENIIDKSIFKEKVTFTGTIPQLQAQNYLAVCDVLVSPQIPNPDGSEFFGSPTKLFEYMAMGKAIIASNLDQIGKIIKHRETGLLFDPNNEVQLAKAIIELYSNPVLRKKLGNNARSEAIDKYTWKQHVDAILDRVSQL